MTSMLLTAGIVLLSCTMISAAAVFVNGIPDDEDSTSYSWTDPISGSVENVHLSPEEVVDHFRSVTENMSPHDTASVVLAFVQTAISYGRDIAIYGQQEYWASPEETLRMRAGDCEDKAVLFRYLAERMGLDTVLVVIEGSSPGHIAAAVALEGTYETILIVDGQEYAYCETAADRYTPIGSVPVRSLENAKIIKNMEK